MALQIKIKNRYDATTVHAVVRMDSKSHALLKQFMHCNDAVVVRFQHGVTLTYRGRGWYRLNVSNEHRALEKLEFAVKLMRRFWREEEQHTEDALKLLAPTMIDPDLQIASFSNAHCEGEYGYLGIASPPPPVPVHKLNALVQKFQRPQPKA
jgi:hypothetical protein